MLRSNEIRAHCLRNISWALYDCLEIKDYTTLRHITYISMYHKSRHGFTCATSYKIYLGLFGIC